MSTEGPKLPDMKLRDEQVCRLLAAGCKVNQHMDITAPPIVDEEARHPTYDILLPNNTVMTVRVNGGEAILRKRYDDSNRMVYDDPFSRKLTWVRDKDGAGKVTGFTLQFD